MHSVVVLGDVRSHVIFPGNRYATGNDAVGHGRYAPRTDLAGGACLVRDVIEHALKVMPAWFRKPNCFGFDKSGSGTSKSTVSKKTKDKFPAEYPVFHWDVEQSAVRGSRFRANRLRMRGIQQSTSQKFPAVQADLLKHLAKGSFEEGNVTCGKAPDILVLDDLGIHLRHVIIEMDYLESKAKKKPKVRPNVRTRLGLTETYNLLFRRIKERRDGVHDSALEPIILGSIFSDLFDPAKDGQQLDNNRLLLWEYIRSDKALSSRTVIVLSAEHLRHTLSISSGYSWERTVEDTLSELQRNEIARKWLHFGHIIVRYGVTGALHLECRSGQILRSTLYFDPRYDDSALVRSELVDTVLGSNAMYIASIVEHLTRSCSTDEQIRKGRADKTGTTQLHVSDLGQAISRSMRDAIIRCQRLYMAGYEVVDATVSTPDYERVVSPADPKNDPKHILDAPRWIASIPVPSTRIRRWSILEASAQNAVHETAKEIVLLGGSRVLNRPQPDINTFLESRLGRDIRKIANMIPEPKALDTNYIDYIINYVLNSWIEEEGGYCSEVGYRLTPGDLKEINSFVSDQTNPADSNYIHALTDALGPLKKVPSLLTQQSESDHSVASKHFTKSVGDERRSNTKPRAASRKSEKHSGDDQVEAWTAIRIALEALLRAHPAIKKLVDYIEPLRDTPSIVAPLMRLGDRFRQSDSTLMIVDRRETEGVGTIQRLITSHMAVVSQGKKVSRPLSIAVFGPPGSGKSSTVRKIVEMSCVDVPGDPAVDILNFNLSQYTTILDLNKAFERIVNSIAGGRIPVAFFDEFDSRLNSEELGWLKFFLSPMEDGRYQDSPVEKAILVFAGGINPTFSAFSLEGRSPQDREMIAFAQAKGPDFVSRLRGHLNIVGVNRVDDDDELYLIRRAIVIRDLLVREQGLRKDDKARIDSDMVRAVLQVPVYRHGGRSVRLLLQMCMDDDRYVSRSALPPIHQLNTQVDGRAFLDLVTGTFR